MEMLMWRQPPRLSRQAKRGGALATAGRLRPLRVVILSEVNASRKRSIYEVEGSLFDQTIPAALWILKWIDGSPYRQPLHAVLKS